ncbi:hypothetical protein ACWGF2_40320 [Streptomyces sp. NPDC054919]
MVVYQRDESGGRRVRVDGEILGMAHSPRDVTEFLRRAGMDDVSEEKVAVSKMIDWGWALPVAGPVVSEWQSDVDRLKLVRGLCAGCGDTIHARHFSSEDRCG